MKVVIKDIDATKLQKSEIFETDNELLDLSSYILMAKKCIAYFASPDLSQQMLRNEDAISFVAEHLMMGTCRWDESKGRAFKSYHNQCAIWAIQNWVSRITKDNPAPYSLNKTLNQDNNVQFYQIL